MSRIWFERDILPSFAASLPESAMILGSATATPDAPYSALSSAQAIMASVFTYDRDVFAQAEDLLVISRTGIGVEKVDIAAATEMGIAVCNAPDGPTLSTAEFAISLMMSVAKNIKPIERELRHELSQGTKRHFYKDYRGIELWDKQLGLVGFGRVAQRVATIAQGIGMRVATYDPYVSAEKTIEMNVQKTESLETLLNTSDVISLHLPLTDDNRQFMNVERFAQMKQGAIFINTARGGHVDESALLDAVDSGHLFGVGIDVTDPEPPNADNPLLARDNVILTPHVASGTQAGKHRIYETALNQILMVLDGKRPPHLVNPEVWERVYARWEKQK